MKKCPFCAEAIQDEAIVCRYCGRDLNKGATAQGPPPPPTIASLAEQGGPKVAAKPELKKSSGCLTVFLWLLLLGFLALVGLAVIGALFGSHTTRSTAGSSSPVVPAAQPEEVPAALTFQAGDLVKEYAANEIAADRMYKNHKVQVSGIVGDIKKEIMGRPYVTLGTGAQFEVRTVQCLFSREDENAVVNLRPGQSLTVRGTVEGLMMNVLLEDCEVVR